MRREGTAVERKQTHEFILDNPTELIITRNVKVSDGAGGSTLSPTPLDPQTVRMVPQVRATSVERRTVGGEVVSPDVNMVAEWDADLQVGDTFKYQNLHMEVVWVYDLGYEKMAEVASR